MVWKVKNTTAAKVDRFGISIDQVVLPNGEEKTFSYLDFAKGVCVLPITANKEVICIKQYRHAMKNWEWELPAGMIDPTDPTPLDSAKKELEEETGYVAEHWLELGSFYPSPGSTTEEIYLYAAAGLTPSIQSLESSEQIELHYLSMEELKDLISQGEFKHGAGLAAVLRYKFLTD
ncbi:ADP-ribose pyrophosphatase [Bacillus sp. SORGH_AS 510]|uniref:NUDIX hydrolase n=1 Tax=Bacillus sp. SORGH_AS_0510 TaxID=3041771 RepID=UPI00277F6217|nr:NUDIX hydrolase [Bacillus sp. SORGH_AS_0510]MDQ1144133.1 ADP-ribose pyrophosphatase [Bacillus sp. SORGH_AS_0510]